MVCRLRGPTDPESLRCIRLGDEVEVNMINFLMSKSTVILKNIVVGQVHGLCKLLCNWKDVGKIFIWQLIHDGCVVLGYYQLKVNEWPTRI